MAKYSVASLTTLAQSVGFKGAAVGIAVAIALAESGGDSSATHPNSNGSVDYGLWQINSIHTEYNYARLISDVTYNATAAFQLSSGGTNWTPWRTYQTGAYKQYLGSVGGGGTSAPTSKAIKGTSNGYPKGQCTWYADDRYHALTGYYVPWSGNAKDWAALAMSKGWSVSPSPIVPSIVCFQAGVQGADTTFGHVGVLERINTDGTLYVSMQNWNGITYPNTTYWTFHTGAGVSFIYAVGGSQSPGGGLSSPVDMPVTFGSVGYTGVLEQVHETIINVPGFYGIALALDEAEQFPGYIDLTQPQTVNIVGINTGVTLPDVSGLIRSGVATVTDNAVPTIIRGTLIATGALLILALLMKAAGSNPQSIAALVAGE